MFCRIEFNNDFIFFPAFWHHRTRRTQIAPRILNSHRRSWSHWWWGNRTSSPRKTPGSTSWRNTSIICWSAWWRRNRPSCFHFMPSVRIWFQHPTPLRHFSIVGFGRCSQKNSGFQAECNSRLKLYILVFIACRRMHILTWALESHLTVDGRMQGSQGSALKRGVIVFLFR